MLNKLMLVHGELPEMPQSCHRAQGESAGLCPVGEAKILTKVEQLKYKVPGAQGGAKSNPCLAGFCHTHRSILTVPDWIQVTQWDVNIRGCYI